MSNNRVNATRAITAGKWLTFKEAEVETKDGTKFNWEYVSRNIEKSDPRTPDAVIVIPFLVSKRSTQSPEDRQIVLIKQYRPPVQAIVLEFPAGLIDKDENIQKAGIRELREETGFVGVAVDVSQSVTFSYDISPTDEAFLTVEIDADLEVNQTPKQELETTENIEVVTIRLCQLNEYLKKCISEGVLVDGRVYMLLRGMEIGRSLSLLNK